MTRCCAHAQSINASTHEFDARVTHGGEAHAALELLAAKFSGVTTRIYELALHGPTSSPDRMLYRYGAQDLYKPRSGSETMSAVFPSLSMWIDCRDGPHGKPRARQRGHSPSSLRHSWRSISGAFDRSPLHRGVERRRPWCTARLRPPERHEPHCARRVATPVRDPCRGLAGCRRV